MVLATAGLSALFALLGAPPDDGRAPGDEELPKVALLPLQAEGVSGETALGMTALFRKGIERAAAGDDVTEPFLVALPEDLKDRKRAKRCRLDVRCLDQLRAERAAGQLAAGVVRPLDEGFEIEVLVIRERGAPRAATEPVGGDEDAIALAFDRLVRAAFAPEALAGSLVVEGGPEGAEVLLDGAVVGVLPLPGPIHGVVEGAHRVRAQRAGYEALERPVRVQFRETASVTMVLSRLEAAEKLAQEEAEALSPVHYWGPGALVVGGAAALGLGAMAGAAALYQALTVQRLAEQQVLVFPRDEFLVRSGQVLALSANVLYGAAGVLLLASGGWLGTALTLHLLGGDDGSAAAYRGPAKGAPTGEDRQEKPPPAFEAPDDDDDPPAKGPLPKGDTR